MNILSIDCDWAKTPEQAIELVRLCKHYQHNENVYFIKDHQTCANYITKGDTLYNVDDHHDLGYNEWQLEDNGVMGRANWVRQLIQRNILEGYVWIKNYDSHTTPEEVLLIMNDIKMWRWEDDTSSLYNKEFDKIIVCESFCTTPVPYRMLFNMLKEIFDRYEVAEPENETKYLHMK